MAELIRRPRRVKRPQAAASAEPRTSIWDQMAQANMPRTLPFSGGYPNPQADALQAAAEESRREMGDAWRDARTGSGGGSRTAFLNSETNTGLPSAPPTGEAWEGFASRYLPGERDLLFRNPRIISNDVVNEGPYANNPQMAGDIGRYADIVFGNANQGGLYELLTAGNLDPNVIGDDDQINYLVDLIREQTKVGGRSPTVRQMLDLLFQGFGNENSTMGGLLTDGNGNPVGTEQAIGALMQFIPLLGEFSGNIRYSNAIRRQANRLAQNYMSRQAKGENKGTFLDYLEQNFLRG